jgi:hypothetical protein
VKGSEPTTYATPPEEAPLEPAAAEEPGDGAPDGTPPPDDAD